MPSRRRKLLTLSAGLAGLAVVIAAGLVMKDPILEFWYMHQLETGTVQEMTGAARRVGRMKSARAVPSLLIAMKRTSAALGYALGSPDWPRSP